MKTPSQRAKDKVKRPRLKTKLEVDIDNGFDGSAYVNPKAANYRTMKNAMERQRARMMKKIDKKLKKQMEEYTIRKNKESEIRKREMTYNKDKSIFDVIDIDD